MNLEKLETERLVLRQIELYDEEEIFFLRSDPRILKYLDTPPAKSIDDARKFIEKIKNGESKKEEWFYWGITLKNKNKLLGTICLWNFSEDRKTADIGYVLHPDSQGNGLMYEAIRKIIDTAFNVLHLHSIDADVTPDNAKSVSLLERNGFTLKKSHDNTVIYSLNKNKICEDF